jgi:hypothetical protein
MKSIRFLAAARRELLAEVLYYNDLEAGLGAKFARALEEALTKKHFCKRLDWFSFGWVDHRSRVSHHHVREGARDNGLRG